MTIKELFFEKTGTIGRLDFLKASVLLWCALVPILYVTNLIFKEYPFINLIVLLMDLILIYNPAVKRYRDNNKPAWFYFLNFIPIVNLYTGLYMLLLKPGIKQQIQ